MTQARLRRAIASALASVATKAGVRSIPFEVVFSDGTTIPLGEGTPVLRIVLRTDAGLAALASLDALAIAEAFMAEDLDLEGDLLAAMRLQESLRDPHPLLFAWRRLLPVLVGRERVNPGWIAL